MSTGGKKPVTRSYAPAFQNLTFDETVLAQGGFALPASARAALVASGFFEELQEPPCGVVSALETPSYLLVADAFRPCNNLSFSNSVSCLRGMKNITSTPTCLIKVLRSPGNPPNIGSTTCIDMFEKTDIYEN